MLDMSIFDGRRFCYMPLLYPCRKRIEFDPKRKNPIAFGVA
jgi:hypothetical protein